MPLHAKSGNEIYQPINEITFNDELKFRMSRAGHDLINSDNSKAGEISKIFVKYFDDIISNWEIEVALWPSFRKGFNLSFHMLMTN